MNELQERISKLSDKDVVRLTLWVFDDTREKIDKELRGKLAEATMVELNSEEVIAAFNSSLYELGIDTLTEKPDSKTVVETFRALLLDYAEENSEIVEENMKDLKIEAGGFELVEILRGIEFPHIIWILTVLGLMFNLSYKNKTIRGTNGKQSIEKEIIITIGFVPEVAKAMLEKLPIFKK